MEQRFVLGLEGRLAGRMFSVEGGVARSEVVPGGSGGFGLREHPPTMDIEPLVCVIGTGMSRAFYDWIGNTVARTHQRKSGSVIQLDHRSKMVRRREFFDALVTEVRFPDLDRFSTSEAVMKVVLHPERIRDTDERVKTLGVYAASLPKAWSVNHFRMQIDGLPTDSAKITKIKGLSLKQGIKQFYTGGDRFPTLEPTKVQLRDITIELPLGYGKEFTKWFEESLDPRKTHAREKNGSIEFLAPGSRSAFFVVALKNIGIVTLAKTANAYRIQLAYQSLKMSAGGAAVK